MSLCPAHREEWMEALDVRATWRPALVQIGGQNEGSLIRHASDTRKHRVETWRTTVRHLQALAEKRCVEGRGCTVTEPTQDPLFEVAA